MSDNPRDEQLAADALVQQRVEETRKAAEAAEAARKAAEAARRD